MLCILLCISGVHNCAYLENYMIVLIMVKDEISAPTFNIWKQSKLPKKTHGIVQT